MFCISKFLLSQISPNILFETDSSITMDRFVLPFFPRERLVASPALQGRKSLTVQSIRQFFVYLVLLTSLFELMNEEDEFSSMHNTVTFLTDKNW